MKNVIAILFAVVLLALVGCSASEPTPTSTPAPPPTSTLPPPTATPSAADRGRIIFENGGAHESYKPEYSCTECHSLDGSEGDEITDGPSLQGISERAGNRVSELSAEEYIRQSIMMPSTYITKGYSNKMGRLNARFLSEEEVDYLVAFLLTQ